MIENNVNKVPNFDFSPDVRNKLLFLSQLKVGDKISIDHKNNNALSISGSTITKLFSPLSFIPIPESVQKKINSNVAAFSRTIACNGDSLEKTVKFLGEFKIVIEEEAKNLNFMSNKDDDIYGLITQDFNVYEKNITQLKEGLGNFCKTYQGHTTGIVSFSKNEETTDEEKLIDVCHQVQVAVREFYHKKNKILNSLVVEQLSKVKQHISTHSYSISKPWYMREVPSLSLETDDVEQMISNLEYENTLLREKIYELSVMILGRKEPEIFFYRSESLYAKKEEIVLDMSDQEEIQEIEISENEKQNRWPEDDNDEDSLSAQYKNIYNLNIVFHLNKGLRLEHRKLQELAKESMLDSFDFKNEFDRTSKIFGLQGNKK